MRRLFAPAGILLAGISAPALAQSDDTIAGLRSEVAQARAELDAQRDQLKKQEERIEALEARLAAANNGAQAVANAAPSPNAPVASPSGPAGTAVATAQQQAPIERVGQAPVDFDRPPEVAVLGDQGSVITRKGQLTAELGLEYSRADRSRAVFRGIEVVESVLVGVFDINESRQDILTASGTLRYGLTDRLELGVRVPFVHRYDHLVLAPIPGSQTNDQAATIDTSASATGIGDVELSARYQLTRARAGLPFLIANLQAVLPTGTDPFAVPRTANGVALDAATGAGFYGISPSLTAILPTDPVVLFGSLGYTFNLGHAVNTRIPPVLITYVNPGDAISFSGGIGISFNQRTTLNLGYAHSWAFGTDTSSMTLDKNGNPVGPVQTLRTRDLQIGRFLFGITYRVTDRATVNWAVEVGATRDAPDVRTTLRIPLVLLTGG